MGMIPVWGNINVYVTSYLRRYDDSLTLGTAFLVFPFTILTGSLFMQLGSYLIDKMHPKLQMLIGGFFFALPVFICSYVKSFVLFAILYSIVLGFGFGLIYMLPIRNAWLFYPEKKGMVSGLILSCYSIGAIAWIFISTAVANPNNEPAALHVKVGKNEEHLFYPDSDVADNVP